MPVNPRLALAALAGALGACVDHPQSAVAGQACIVFDPRFPGRCGAQQIVDGLTVVELTTGRQTATDATGKFRIPMPAGDAELVLRIAEDRTDRRTSLVGVATAPIEGVLAPVITTTLWDTFVASLRLPPEDPTRAIIHISFPPPGALVGGGDIPGATTVLYNLGDAFAWGPQPPLDQEFAMLAFGVPINDGTATINVVSRAGQVVYHGVVPVQAGAITWVIGAPAAPAALGAPGELGAR